MHAQHTGGLLRHFFKNLNKHLALQGPPGGQTVRHHLPMSTNPVDNPLGGEFIGWTNRKVGGSSMQVKQSGGQFGSGGNNHDSFVQHWSLVQKFNFLIPKSNLYTFYIHVRKKSEENRHVGNYSSVRTRVFYRIPVSKDKDWQGVYLLSSTGHWTNHWSSLYGQKVMPVQLHFRIGI